MVSDQFRAEALKSTQTIRSVCTVTDVVSGSGAQVDVDHLTGAVSANVHDDTLRTLTVTFDPSLSPTDADDILAPFGNEIAISRGFVYDDGTEELAPLGVFRHDGYQIVAAGDGTRLQLAASDRSVQIIDNPWSDTKVVAAGGQVDEVVATLAADRYPLVDMALPTISTALPRLVFAIGSNPWAQLRKIVADAGLRLHFDATGRLTASPPPSYDAEPVVTYGPDKAVMLTASRGQNVRGNVFSGVVMVAGGTGVTIPLRSIVTDDDGDSPTRHGGPFGTRLEPNRTTTVLTQTALNVAAQARWETIRGAVEIVQLEQIVDPSVEPGEVRAVTHPSAGLDATPVVFDAPTIPLEPETAMTVRGRRRFL